MSEITDKAKPNNIPEEPEEQGEKEEAVSPLAGLEQKVRDAQKAYQQAGFELSREYLMAGREEEGFHLLRKLVRSATPEEAVKLTAYLGSILTAKGEYERSLEAFREAIVLEPTDPFQWYAAHNNAGFCLIMLGRPQEAEPLLRDAVRIDPKRPAAHKNLGMAAESLGRPADAVLHYVHATRLCPADPRAFDLLQDLATNEPLIHALVPAMDTMLEACRDLVESYPGPKIEYSRVHRVRPPAGANQLPDDQKKGE